MTKDQLHEELIQLGLSKTSRTMAMVVHALIELEQIVRLECHAEKCLFDSRKFDRSGSSPRHKVLSLDHIVERCNGGTERPENIRLLHFACNSSLGGKTGSRRVNMNCGVAQRPSASGS